MWIKNGMPNVSTDAYGAPYWQYVNGLSGGANNFSANLREQIRKRRYLTRFAESYSLAPSVDCWVHTGDFGGSLRASSTCAARRSTALRHECAAGVIPSSYDSLAQQ